MVSKELICVAGIFLFSKSWRLVSPSGTFLGEIIGLCCRTGLSAVFSSCCVAALQACETSRLGPPFPMGDLGLFWAIPPLGWVRNRSSSANELGSGYFQENFPVRVAQASDRTIENERLCVLDLTYFEGGLLGAAGSGGFLARIRSRCWYR